MGQFSGEYSRDPRAVFDELKRYPVGLVQEGIPWIDADDNDYRMANYTSRRRLVQLFGDYGTPNDAFFILEASSPTNNFEIRGGGGTAETAGRFFMKGHECILADDVDYISDGSTEGERSIHSRITNLSYSVHVTTVTDSSANWLTGELIGRNVTLDITDAAFGEGFTWPTITGNTATTFTFADTDGDIYALLANGMHYRVDLTTPSGSRTDAVYLNVYMDEYDSADDANLVHSIGNQSIPGQLRLKTIQNIHVAEGSTATTHWDGLSGTYTDTDGNVHYIFKLASYTRGAADSDINTGDITNNVPTIGVSSYGQEALEDLRAIPEAVPTNTVYVNSGQALKTDGKAPVVWIGGSSPTFPVVPSDQERYDVLVLRDNSTLERIAGTPSAAPAAKPDFDTNGFPIAYIYVDEDTTVVIDTDDITDVRPLLTSDVLPRLRLDSPSEADSVLSTVTVGERGCDYTTIEAALTYVNSLTTSANRQFAVQLFEKKNGSTWTPAAILSIPDWTHLIGIGKPTIDLKGKSGNLITLGEGASAENLRVLVNNSWTHVLYTADDDVTIRNVIVQYDDAVNDNANSAFYAESASRFRLLDCKLLRDDGGVKGCQGVIFGNDVYDSIIDNCYFEGTDALIYMTTLTERCQFSNLFLDANKAAAAHGGLIRGGYNQVSNVFVTVTTAVIGLEIVGGSASERTDAVNIAVEVTGVNDDCQAIEVDHCSITNPTIKGGRLKVNGECTISGGNVYYASTATFEAVGVYGLANIINGLRIDRGGVNEPCIEPMDAAADENQVIGCRCYKGVGGVASIANVLGTATDWLLVGNYVDVATALGNGWDIVGEKVI